MVKRIGKVFLTILTVFILLLSSFYVYLRLNARTPILMYHSFMESRLGKYPVVTPAVFEKQMAFIKKHKYNVLALGEYCRRIKEGERIPRNSVVITIDDGYKDNLAAIKILDKYDFPATIFVIVNKIGQEGYLSGDDIAAFLRETKVRIGSHTLSESYLPDAATAELPYEITQSKVILQQMFETPVETFSYSTGGFDERVLKEVEKAQYTCACTTNRGFTRKRNRLALRRIKISNRDIGIRLWGKLSGFYNIFKKPKNPY